MAGSHPLASGPQRVQPSAECSHDNRPGASRPASLSPGDLTTVAADHIGPGLNAINSSRCHDGGRDVDSVGAVGRVPHRRRGAAPSRARRKATLRTVSRLGNSPVSTVRFLANETAAIESEQGARRGRRWPVVSAQVPWPETHRAVPDAPVDAWSGTFGWLGQHDPLPIRGRLIFRLLCQSPREGMNGRSVLSAFPLPAASCRDRRSVVVATADGDTQ